MKLKEGAKRMLAHIPLKHMILFESNPDFADNTWPLYLELKKRLPSFFIAVPQLETQRLFVFLLGT